MRSLWVPLAFYLAITVVVPVVNGTARGGAFLEHVLIVVLVSAAVAGATGWSSRALRRR